MNTFQYKRTDAAHEIELRLSRDFLMAYYDMNVIKNKRGYKVKLNGNVSMSDIYGVDGESLSKTSGIGKSISLNFRICIRSPYISAVSDISTNKFTIMISKDSIMKSDHFLIRRKLPLSASPKYIEDLKSTLIAMSKHLKETKEFRLNG